MFTFIGGIILLIIGYFTYGKFVEKVFGVKDDRPTPALTKKDNVDYMPLKKTKNSLIELISIAGVGPIFGPIMGALYGPVAFVWIVIGCIFAGAVHDYLTGMISIRNGGAHLPQLAGKFLGRFMKHIVNIFSILLLLLVGTVFVSSSATLIFDVINGKVALTILIGIVFVYYILSTMLPIDKIIGKLFPIFGILLLLSTISLGIGLVVTQAPIPELSFTNIHPEEAPIFPLLFLVISCGAISGFHATQSPIIARTTGREKEGRGIFYGMMIGEGIIAMVWAAAAMSLFDGPVSLNELINTVGTSGIVSEAATMMFGSIIGTIVVISIIALPLSSGDTAFRSARMVIADYFNIPQKKIIKRLMIALPLFAISIVLSTMDFTLLWRYFSWANQSLAVIALWVGAMYLFIGKRNYWIAFIPGIFMTYVVTAYILNAPIGFRLPMDITYILSAIITISVILLFFKYARINRAKEFPMDEDLKEWTENPAVAVPHC
ncbi:carbon starvation CstA family protein [Ornithinibacillus halophilus]|uniref:Carbon starvation protein CstA n=1 Tax=Ornithinibacillus halophilus TaxID=930117 RepID=A0A1M5IIJ4_9BACI|nr:carbon starvation CstA family protein [Ornithinibacillus halophilus]SHG28168.1 Carbon starvation protein CstA [Ornithinibacillus halophilus]